VIKERKLQVNAWDHHVKVIKEMFVKQMTRMDTKNSPEKESANNIRILSDEMKSQAEALEELKQN